MVGPQRELVDFGCKSVLIQCAFKFTLPPEDDGNLDVQIGGIGMVLFDVVNRVAVFLNSFRQLALLAVVVTNSLVFDGIFDGAFVLLEHLLLLVHFSKDGVDRRSRPLDVLVRLHQHAFEDPQGTRECHQPLLEFFELEEGSANPVIRSTSVFVEFPQIRFPHEECFTELHQRACGILELPAQIMSTLEIDLGLIQLLAPFRHLFVVALAIVRLGFGLESSCAGTVVPGGTGSRVGAVIVVATSGVLIVGSTGRFRFRRT
mmetsp:Transcript_19762/g.55850  ORF Transcript_19762/g.55850 Transcript_19762/m.55850 type:complete len:260 (+) Transcript_19762:474-1253(+)